MMRENQRLLNQLHVFTDGLAVFLAMLVSYWLRFSLFRGVRGHAPELLYLAGRGGRGPDAGGVRCGRAVRVVSYRALPWRPAAWRRWSCWCR